MMGMRIFYFILLFIVSAGCSSTTVPIRNDKETQSAVGAITEAVTGAGRTVRYCPVTGRRYSPKFETCPVHGVVLKEVEE